MKHSLKSILRPGNKVRMFNAVKGGNLGHGLIHIRAIVDEEEVVYKVWMKHKQCWRYIVDSIYFFELYYNRGQLKLVGKDK